MVNIRRLIVPFVTATGLLLAAVALSACEDAEVRVKTFTYKKAGNLEIKADVLLANRPGPRPIVVWIHGGALINGGREGVGRKAQEMLLEAGYSIVSIDYRLAPETKLPEIIEDLEDAFSWIRDQGPALFDARTDKLAVMGTSAGGYLTLTSGFRVEPRPTVLISFFGYGDLIGEWYSEPSSHPRHHRKSMTSLEVEEMIEGPAVSNSRDRLGDGGAFYQYCRQKGVWPSLVSGFDPHTQAERFIPFMPLRNVSSEYPPTMLIHGTNDTDVPYRQSELMARQLEQHGVPFELQTLAGAEHGLAGANPEDIEKLYQSILRFLNQHMIGDR